MRYYVNPANAQIMRTEINSWKPPEGSVEVKEHEFLGFKGVVARLTGRAKSIPRTPGTWHVLGNGPSLKWSHRVIQPMGGTVIATNGAASAIGDVKVHHWLACDAIDDDRPLNRWIRTWLSGFHGTAWRNAKTIGRELLSGEWAGREPDCLFENIGFPSDGLGKLFWRRSSCHAATNLAILMGANRIIVHGVDMIDRSHCYGGVIAGDPKDKPGFPWDDLGMHVEGWSRLLELAEKRGVELLNVNPNSAVRVMPFLKGVRVQVEVVPEPPRPPSGLDDLVEEMEAMKVDRPAGDQKAVYDPTRAQSISDSRVIEDAVASSVDARTEVEAYGNLADVAPTNEIRWKVMACNEPYVGMAKRLAGQMRALGFDVEVIAYDETGDWMRDCMQRAGILSGMLDCMTSPIGLIDADVELLGSPDMLKALPADVDVMGVHRPGRKRNDEHGAGTVAFSTSLKGRECLRRWADKCKADEEQALNLREQAYLHDAIVEGGCQFLPLPREYDVVPPRNSSKWKAPEGTVLLHLPASRKTRKKASRLRT